MDDEAPALELLRLYLGRMNQCEIVGEFESPIEFLKAEPNLIYDLLISDVDMPGMKGTDLIKMITKQIIFVTGKASVYGSELMVAGLEASHVIGSIPKPIKFDLLEKAVGKVNSNEEQKPRLEMPIKEYIRLKIKDGTANIKISDILAVSTLEFEKQQRGLGGGNKKVYLESGPPMVITDISLDQVFKQINSPNFFILSDSCLVQKKAVMGHTKTKAFVRMNIDPTLYEPDRAGFSVPISENKRDAFIRFLES